MKAHTAFGGGPTTTKKCAGEGTNILLGAWESTWRWAAGNIVSEVQNCFDLILGVCTTLFDSKLLKFNSDDISFFIVTYSIEYICTGESKILILWLCILIFLTFLKQNKQTNKTNQVSWLSK